MTLKMIVNAVDQEEIRLAIVDDGFLEDYDIETQGVEKNRGNIYKGVVMAVEPALNAAFVDYGADKQGFITAHDVDPKYAGKDDDKVYRINELLKPKQQILVQVTKDEVSTKGAVLTTYLSLAGRYLVLMPGSSRHGVSRKIEDDDTRRKMREAAAKLEVPDGMGVIIRTAGKDRNKGDLNRDLKVLLRLWDNIQKESEQLKAPALIFKEQDVIIRALRDYFSAQIDEVVVDSDAAFDRASEYMHLVMPKQRHVLTRYVERRPIFHHYRIEEQLEALYSHKVNLRSGGSIVIDQTEALVAIDVNSGKQKMGGQEETALQTNLESAREVARQLRLRDLGGIIVVDFIDMASRKHELRVERALRDAVKTDRARIKVGRISPNGTLELTRQRIGSALQVSMFHRCSTCGGSGHILKPEAHAVAVLRKLRDRAARGDLVAAKVRVESETANQLRTEKWSSVQEIEQRFNVRIDIVVDHGILPGHDDFTFETDPNATVIELEEPDFGPAWRPDDFEEELDDELDDDEEDEDDEDTDDDEREDEDADEEAVADRRPSRDRGRGPRRSARGGRDRGDRSHQAARGRDAERRPDPMGLPSFELIDPAELGLTAGGDGQNGDGEKAGRRRSRRGGRRRGGRTSQEQRQGQLANAPKTTANGDGHKPASQPSRGQEAQAQGAVAEAAPERKPSFFARLFGRKG